MMKKKSLHIINFLALLFLTSCSSLPWPDSLLTSEFYQKKYSVLPPKHSLDAYYTIKEPLQCVPYAREVSGIQLRGNAYTWWNSAAGKYYRGRTPKVGAVMVLSKTSRLQYGHLAVVKGVVDNRNIIVTHSNWGGDRKTRSYVYNKMPVVDVSTNNDWSSVRFWDYPSGSYGSVYTASGFIYPNETTSPTPRAVMQSTLNKTNIPLPRQKPLL